MLTPIHNHTLTRGRCDYHFRHLGRLNPASMSGREVFLNDDSVVSTHPISDPLPMPRPWYMAPMIASMSPALDSAPRARRNTNSRPKLPSACWSEVDELEQLPSNALEDEEEELKLDLELDEREQEEINNRLEEFKGATRGLQLLGAMVALRKGWHESHLKTVEGEIHRREMHEASTVGRTPPKKPTKVEDAKKRLHEEVDVHHLWVHPELWHERGGAHTDEHQDEVDEEARKATWTELFFDLVYVAAGLKLGQALKNNLSWPAVLEFCAAFVPLFAVWIRSCEYQNRFYSKDLMSKAVFGLYFVTTVITVTPP